MSGTGFCSDCPLRPDEAAEDACLDHPDRKARLVLYAASGVPVQCHKAITAENIGKAVELFETPGKDWRLDLPVTVPCFGTINREQRFDTSHRQSKVGGGA